MINERIISDKFSVIWKQHFPLLTADFMRFFNYEEQITINDRPVPMSKDVRYDLISELSFFIASESCIKKSSIDSIITNKEKLDLIVTKTAQTIWESNSYKNIEIQLSDAEIRDTKLICKNTLEFIKKLKVTSVKFRPILKGYSIIPDLVADVAIDDTLYEIKTVNRNFRSSDLKQLFIYLALQQATGEMKWKSAGLYNPRRGKYCKFDVKELVYKLSGGRSSTEVFESFLDSFNREIEFDSQF